MVLVMSEYLEVPGSEGCVIYHLHFMDGPMEGTIDNSFRPYDKIIIRGLTYQAKEEGESCVQWLDDWTRKIELYLVVKNE